MEIGEDYRMWYKDDAGQVREREIRFLGWSGQSLLYLNLKTSKKNSINKDLFIRSEEL